MNRGEASLPRHTPVRDGLLGGGLAALAFLFPLPPALRPALPLLVLLAARGGLAPRPLTACGAFFFLGLGLGPLALCADGRAGTPWDWGLSVAALLPWIGRSVSKRPRPETGPARSRIGLLAAFAGGAAGAVILETARPLFAPFAGRGAAAALVLSSAFLLAFAAGLGLGAFLLARFPRAGRGLGPAALLAGAAGAVLFLHPAAGLYRLGFMVHRPDEHALEFAAGNLFIAWRLCGPAAVCLGAALAPLFLARPGSERSALLPPVSWIAGFGLMPLILGIPAVKSACASLEIPPPVPIRSGDALSPDPPFLALSNGACTILPFSSKEDTRLVWNGCVLADGSLAFPHALKEGLTHLVRLFEAGLPPGTPVRLHGVEAVLLRRSSTQRSRSEGKGDAVCFLPSTLHAGEVQAARIFRALEDASRPAGVVLDLSTLSPRAIALLLEPLLRARPGAQAWVDPPFLLAADLPPGAMARIRAAYPFPGREGVFPHALPCPVPVERLLHAPARSFGAFDRALALEAGGRRGPFPDPRLAARNLAWIQAALPHRASRTGLSPEQTFLYRWTLLLGAAIRRSEGRYGDTLRVLEALEIQFPGEEWIPSLSTRTHVLAEGRRRTWRLRVARDGTDADALLALGVIQMDEGNPEGVLRARRASELRHNLRAAFEISAEGLAGLLRSASGESKRHLLRTVNSYTRYAERMHGRTHRFTAHRGWALFLGGVTHAARAAFTSALEGDPSLETARRGLAALALLENQPARALHEAREAVRLDPCDAEAWFLRAAAASRLGPEGVREAREGYEAFFLLRGSAEGLAGFPGDG